MKRGLIIFLVFLLIPYISAASIEMKSYYDQGETIIAKVSGDFFEPIKESNVFFYRGHVKIPMDYDVGKVGQDYYIKASLIGKSSNNYSLKIQGVHYYNAGRLISDDIIKNFSITNNLSDFAIDPGFIISVGNFSIKARNLQNYLLSLSINAPNGIKFQTSLSLSPGQMKEIFFDTSEVKESILGNIGISDSNLNYVVPIYFNYQPPQQNPYCGDGRVDPGEQCDARDWGLITGCIDFGFNDGTLSCNAQNTDGECNFDLRNCFNTLDTGCSSDNDCEENQVCMEDGKCVDLEPSNEPQEPCGNGVIDIGEQCDGKNFGAIKGCSYFSFNNGTLSCNNPGTSNECTFDLSNCFNTTNVKCSSINDCGENQECIGGKCADVPPPKEPECYIPDDCKLGYTCVNKTCVPEKPETIEPYCGDRIISSGEQCDRSTFGTVRSCEQLGFNEGTLNCIKCVLDTSSCFNRNRDYECWYNSDCNQGYKCDNLKCVKDEVRRCSSVEDCKSGEICFREVCFQMPKCKYDSNCRIGFECDDNGECVKIEDECSEDKDCEDDRECNKEGFCVKKQGKECRYDRDCEDGYTCESGHCLETPECIEDRDCLIGYNISGYKCEDNFCIKEKGDECSFFKSCNDTYNCENGYCIKKEVEKECETFRECPRNFTCVRGQCISVATSKSCKELGGDLCNTDEGCEGSSKKILDYICCLDTQCKQKEKSSTGKIIGWSLIGIVVLALFYFFIKYKKAKRN